MLRLSINAILMILEGDPTRSTTSGMHLSMRIFTQSLYLIENAPVCGLETLQFTQIASFEQYMIFKKYADLVRMDFLR